MMMIPLYVPTGNPLGAFSLLTKVSPRYMHNTVSVDRLGITMIGGESLFRWENAVEIDPPRRSELQ